MYKIVNKIPKSLSSILGKIQKNMTLYKYKCYCSCIDTITNTINSYIIQFTK